MIIEANSKLGSKVMLINTITGCKITTPVKSFNTETNEAVVYVQQQESSNYLEYGKMYDKYESIKDFRKTNISYEGKSNCAIFDESGNKGSLTNGSNELVTAIITLRNVVAINKETLEEIL